MKGMSIFLVLVHQKQVTFFTVNASISDKNLETLSKILFPFVSPLHFAMLL